MDIIGKHIFIKLLMTLPFIIFLVVFPHHDVAGRGINKDSTKMTKECTVSEVLNRLGVLYGTKVTISKNIQKIIPCDAKYRGNIEEEIRNLLSQENNYAVEWRLKDKGIKSVHIRFLESSRKDHGNKNIIITTKLDHRRTNDELAMNTDSSEKKSEYSIVLRMMTSPSESINLGDIALGTESNNSEGGCATEKNRANVNVAVDNRRESSERLTPELKDGEYPFIFPTSEQKIDLRAAFPLAAQLTDSAEYFPPSKQQVITSVTSPLQ